MSEHVDALVFEEAKEKQENAATTGTPLDKTDAHPFHCGSDQPGTEYPVAQLTVQHDCPNYCMNSDRRGRCIIFNHRRFDPRCRMSERHGTEIDAVSLTDCFNRLKFHVELIEDASAIEIRAKLKSLSLEMSNEDECLVICVLSHGERGNLWAFDQLYPVDDLYQQFTADKCAPLAGKPKLFFIQACQGDTVDKGVVVRSHMDQIDGPGASYKIPIWADFMIVYSTIAGYCSWRRAEKGSWFIQSLTQILNKHADSMDLLSMLTLVNRKVAYDFVSECHGERRGGKQVPCVTSMLTRKVYLIPSSQKDESSASK